MKTTITILFFLFLFVGLNGQTVRNFQLKDIDNVSHSFSELKGDKLTVIDFWASWCKPCQKAIPELNKIYEKYKEKGVQIIGINCDGPRSVSKVSPLVNSLQIKYPVLLDINSEVMNKLNLSAFPTLVLANSEGKIVWIHEGFVEGDTESIVSEIEKNIK
jgi:cytochrome c biogenesis protein CcmG, thiol:disulfide interchange protein DsbE